MVNWLLGKKTYIVAICTLIYGIGLCVNGHSDQGIPVILGALGFAGLRSGVSQEVGKTKDIVQSAAGLKVVEMTPAEAVTEDAGKKP